MQIISTHKIVVCDVDDTLILWNVSEYPTLTKKRITYGSYAPEVAVHTKNVNLLIKLAKLDYTIIVWSMTGFDWAEAVVNALELQPYVTVCMSKPRLYVDDKEAERWMGERVWREPKGDV